jgi:hypothetical protein
MCLRQEHKTGAEGAADRPSGHNASSKFSIHVVPRYSRMVSMEGMEAGNTFQ